MRILIVFMGVLLVVSQPVLAQTVPHKGIYDITLHSRKQGSDVQSIEGTLTYKLTKTCDGWGTDYVSDITYSLSNGAANPVKSTYSARESMDGTEMDFAMRRFEQNRLKESLRGHAAQTDAGLDVHAISLSGRIETHFDVQGVFPQMHAEKVLQSAIAGKKIYQAKLFDGSFSDRYTIVNAVISPLETDKTWRVAMAFYDPNATSLEPEYEMHFTLSRDGVIREMDIVYPDFTLSQTLHDVKLLEQPSCD